MLVAAVFGILAVSLDLVAGVAGLYSLGHAGLFAIGAYGTTILHNDHGWNLFLLLPASMLGVGVVGLVLGSLSLRVSGLYFAITTFIFTLVVTVLASDLAITGGYGGLIGPIFPEFPSSLEWLGASLIWCCMLALLVAILLSLGIRRSPLYPVLLAIRDAEPFAAAAGARTSLLKIGLFGLSAAMAGAAGWIFAFQGIVSPSQFDWTVSVNILVMVILGGINTTLGPVIGAAFVTIFPAHVNINPFWQEVLFGALFVAMVILYPPGFMGFVNAVAPACSRARPRTVLRRARSRRDERSCAHPQRPPSLQRERARRSARIRCGLPRHVLRVHAKARPVLRDVDFRVRRASIHGLDRTERIRQDDSRRPHRGPPPAARGDDRARRPSVGGRGPRGPRAKRVHAHLPGAGSRPRAHDRAKRRDRALCEDAAHRRARAVVAGAARGASGRPTAAPDGSRLARLRRSE